MTGFLDWLGRVIMLVLAGMITLSIIGAIASIPSGTIETRLAREPTGWPEPRESRPLPPPPNPAPQVEEPAATVPAESPNSAPSAVVTPVPAPERPANPAEWLEPIAYALLALAGLLAFGIILFWRALGYWRRSAEAMEALAARRPPDQKGKI